MKRLMMMSAPRYVSMGGFLVSFGVWADGIDTVDIYADVLYSLRIRIANERFAFIVAHLI